MQHKPSTHSRLIIIVLFTFCSSNRNIHPFFSSLFFMATPSIARTCHLVLCSLNINNLFFVVAYDMILIVIKNFLDLIKYWVYNFFCFDGRPHLHKCSTHNFYNFVFAINPNTRDEILSSFAPIQISKQYTRQFRVWIQFYF